jgi:CRP-like cAMP-binding protein
MAYLPLNSVTALLDLLTSLPAARTEADLQAIVHHLLSLQAIRDLADTTSREAVCRTITLEDFAKGQVVFTLGDLARRFYILLKGRAVGKMPTTKLQQAQRRKEMHIGATSEAAITSLIEKLRTIQPARRSPERSRALSEADFTQVFSFSPGACLCDLTINETEEREITVECIENCTLLVLPMEAYAAAVQEYEEKRVKEHVKDLREIPAFSKWTRKSLSQLIKAMKERKCVKGEVLYREGDSANSVFFISSGEFKFCKEVGVDQTLLEREVGNAGLPSIRRQRFPSPHKAKPEVAVLTKSARQVFGFMEVMEDCSRIFTCVCISRIAVVLELPKQDFLRRTQNQDTWAVLQRMTRAEGDWVLGMLAKLSNAELAKQRIALSKPRPRTPSVSLSSNNISVRHKRVASMAESNAVNSTFEVNVSKSYIATDRSRVFASYRAKPTETPQPRMPESRLDLIKLPRISPV